MAQYADVPHMVQRAGWQPQAFHRHTQSGLSWLIWAAFRQGQAYRVANPAGEHSQVNPRQGTSTTKPHLAKVSKAALEPAGGAGTHVQRVHVTRAQNLTK